MPGLKFYGWRSDCLFPDALNATVQRFGRTAYVTQDKATFSATFADHAASDLVKLVETALMNLNMFRKFISRF